MKILSSLFLLILAFQMNAQEYKVVHVNGNIVAESTKKTIVRGTAFKKSEKFQYKSNDARAVVINTNAGKRYILKGNSSAGYTNANLTPSMGNISSRAGALNNRLDLKNHFDGKYVILGQLEVVINSTAFPMSDTQFCHSCMKCGGGKTNYYIRSVDSVFQCRGIHHIKLYSFTVGMIPNQRFRLANQLIHGDQMVTFVQKIVDQRSRHHARAQQQDILHWYSSQG